MKYIFLASFIIFTLLHLIASYNKNQPFRNVTKGFIVFSLLAFYILSTPSPMWRLVLALIFSFIGDMLLIKKGIKWFAIGGVSFMISHLFFILSYSKLIDFSSIKFYIWIILAIAYISLVTFIFSKLKERLPKQLFYPMYLYLLVNGAMNCFALVTAFSNLNLSSIIIALGAISFFVSDTLLFFVRFPKNKNEEKSHFAVMTCYIIAELLITLGFII